MNPSQTQYEKSRDWGTLSQAQSSSRAGSMRPSQDLAEYVRDFAREKPEVFALWCFGIGFVLGWKLKPW